MAFVHKSASSEKPKKKRKGRKKITLQGMTAMVEAQARRQGKCVCDPDNERLEFLGDAIIEAVVSDVLYHRFPEYAEGSLSKLRSNMVCRTRLNEISFALGMDSYIRVSTPQLITVSHIPGDVLEAFVAAIFLDGGMKRADKFVRRHIANDMRIAQALQDTDETNYKSELISLGEQSCIEIYFDTHRIEPEHGTRGDAENYTTEVRAGQTVIGQAKGRSKKMAEQEAAAMACKAIKDGGLDLRELATRQEEQGQEESAATNDSDVSQEVSGMDCSDGMKENATTGGPEADLPKEGEEKQENPTEMERSQG